MELYEIKNGLDKAHLLIKEYRKSAQIDEKLREIEGKKVFGINQIMLKKSMINLTI